MEGRPKPARIRLTQEQGGLLRLILSQHLSLQWEARAHAPEHGHRKSEMNRTIKLTRQMLDELDRTRREAGWS